ncbi:MAG: hypothetical protein AB7S26_21125 [Sandaracinaceae bacterium]
MRVTVLSACLLVACGASPEPDGGAAIDDAGMPDAGRDDAGCTPSACELRCGDVSDDCGGTLSCPACPECASDADCAFGTFCDLGHGVCTTGCRTGPHAAIDIPLVQVDVEVTLNGDAIPAAPAPAQLRFVPLGPVASPGSTLEVYDATGPVSPLRATLAPGDYIVYYEGELGLTPSRWPAERYVELTTVTVTPETTSLRFDVPTALVRFDLTLDGAPLPDVGIESPWIFGYRVDSRGSRFEAWRFQLPPGASSFERYLVPGRESFEYARGGPLPGWPPGGVIGEDVEVGASPSIALDIPHARLTIRLTRDGAPAPDGVRLNTGDYPVGPGIGTTSGGELTVDVVPGPIRLWSVGGPIDWPREQWPIAELTIVDDTTVDVDVDPVLVPIDARLDATLDDGCRALAAVTLNGQRIPLPPVGETAHVDLWLFPGEKPVEYQAPPPCGEVWPRQSVVLDPIQIVDASPQRIDVPTVRVAFDVTFDGAPPPDVEPGPSPIRLLLRASGGYTDDGVVPLYERVGSEWHVVPPVGALVPGRYDVLLSVAGGLGWASGDVLVQEDVLFDADTTRSLAVETVVATLEASLGGDYPPTESWSSTLLLDRSFRNRLAPWRSSDVYPPPLVIVFRAIRGRYDVEYYATRLGGSPLDAAGQLPPARIALGCWEL